MNASVTNRKLYFQIILLSSLSIASIYLVLGIIRNTQSNWLQLLIDFLRIFIFSVALWVLNLSLFFYFNQKVSQRLAYFIIIVITSFVAYFGMLIISNSLSVVSEIRVVKPVGVGFRGVVANLLIITYLYSTTIFSKFKQVEAENERLKSNQLEGQLLQLKAQLNPHFLFNSLNTLKVMVEDKDENSVEYLIKLSEVYRYFLDNSESHLATVQAELKIAQAYFFMLKNRFEDNISLEISLSSKALERKMPAMSLQLLIENAVKHNVISKGKSLKICVYETDNQLVVKNNIQPKRSVELSTQIGLKNLNDRSKLLTYQEVEIEKTEKAFTVKIPFA